MRSKRSGRRGRRAQAATEEQDPTRWQDPAGRGRGRAPSGADGGSAEASRSGRRGGARRPGRSSKHKEPSFVSRLVHHWWNRIIGAVYSRSFSEQTEEYAEGDTTKDYLFNTAGQGLWGALFPLLTIVATNLAGTEHAGMFSMAFVTATMLMYIGNYGVRTYQVSDLEETDSFAAYQIQRVLTCLIMLAVGWLYMRVRGYTGDMVTICWGAFAYRAVDAFADVYEGRLQQMDKLYLAGTSMGIRSGLSFVVFTVLLFLTRSLPFASVAMAVVAVATLVVVTIPLTYFETDKSRRPQLVEIRELFVECFPAFCGMFLYALIDNVPKYVMEGLLPYDDQIYFNAIYFGANAILMAGGFVYKPQLVRLANIWSDSSKRGRFDLLVVAMMAAIVVISVVMWGFVALIGVRLNTFLYGVDFEPYRLDAYLMVVAGGLAAGIDFLFQLLTVLRHQAQATRLYLVALVVAIVLSFALTQMMGFGGAVWAYLATHVVLFGLFVAQYVGVRIHDR